jgi:hypothetical protein
LVALLIGCVVRCKEFAQLKFELIVDLERNGRRVRRIAIPFRVRQGIDSKSRHHQRSSAAVGLEVRASWIDVERGSSMIFAAAYLEK